MSIDNDLETEQPLAFPYPWTTSTTKETVGEFLDSLSEDERRILEAAAGGIQQPFKLPQTVLV